MLMRFITGIIVFAGLFTGNYFAFMADNFDFQSAGVEERTRWLKTKALGMKRRFKPHYLASIVETEVRGSQIVFTYSMVEDPEYCMNVPSCEELQCRRYFGSSLDRQDITVRLIYTDERLRQVGVHRLSDSSCRDFREEEV
ncbi:MAG: hypothetical protein AAFS13_07595 [Pseudomonadota bacterium]